MEHECDEVVKDMHDGAQAAHAMRKIRSSATA